MTKKLIKYIYYKNDDSSYKFCTESISSFLSEEKLTPKNILFITVFISIDKRNFSAKNKIIDDLFADASIDIPYLVVAQTPFESEIAFEILYSKSDLKVIESNSDFKIIKSRDSQELFVSVFSAEKNSPEKMIFEQLNSIFQKSGFEVHQIVRQWNYIEDILLISGSEQNYQKFNNGRSEFYSHADWKNGYPAATGIGTNAGGVSISIHAIKPEDNLNILPLKNPNQIDAHSYSVEVLVGQRKKTTPKFERGKLIIYNNTFDLYVSGTAAIIGEEALKDSEAAKQTIATIENIERLTSISNIQPNFKKELNFRKVHFNNLRVYIKNDTDYPIVKQICDTRFPDIPIIYLKADVCRDELLVEIEANIFSIEFE